MTNTAATSVQTNGLFDATSYTRRSLEGVLEVVDLDSLELAANPRNDIDEQSIRRLSGMLMRTGQLVPAIGRKDGDKVLLYAGQRRLLAARASHQLAGTEGFENLKPVAGLMVLLLEYEPSKADIRRIQAQENQREDLSARDQQDQFADCWADRAGLPEDDRLAVVCEDLGISAKKAHNLRRQLTLPDDIRVRVADRPGGGQLSATLANRLADMHDTAPQLARAVSERVSSTDLHDHAVRDMGAFVHRTVVENEKVYAVRIDEGSLLDGFEQVKQAAGHLPVASHQAIATLLECDVDKVMTALDTLASRARHGAVKVRITSERRERAVNGRFAYVHRRGEDFADGVWVVDPTFVIELVHTELGEEHDAPPARDEAFFGGASLDDEDLKAAKEAEEQRKQAEALRRREGVTSNLGLGHDIAAGLMDPTSEQLSAMRSLICHLLIQHYPDVIAYGAGWTDQQRQQPVGDFGRHEPRQPQTILDAELQRALDDPDPLRGIAQLTARFCAAFVIDEGGITKTKALGSDRMTRKLRDALPGGDNPLRDAVWKFMRPLLSPRLAEMHRDAFVSDEFTGTTIDLAAYRGDSDLEDLDLGEDTADVA